MKVFIPEALYLSDSIGSICNFYRREEGIEGMKVSTFFLLYLSCQ
jgi:hypothetical protein